MESDIVNPSQLLDELRMSYQALTFKERKQVTAFLSEFSCGDEYLGEVRKARSADALLEM